MDQEALYRNAARDKKRLTEIAYLLTGIPWDNHHESWEEDQWRRDVASKRLKRPAPGRSEDCDATLSRNVQPTWNTLAGSGWSSNTEPSLPLPTSNRRTMTKANSTGPVQQQDENDQDRNLPNNVWWVRLLFDNGCENQQFEGRVVLDLGAEDNWMSESVRMRHNIPFEDEETDHSIYRDFSDSVVKSLGCVRAQWFYRGSPIHVKFKVVRRAPFAALFGHVTLLAENIVTINTDSPSRCVIPLVRGTAAPNGDGQSRLLSSLRTVAYAGGNANHVLPII